MRFVLVRNTVRCGERRSPSSKIACEAIVQEEYLEDRVQAWILRETPHWTNPDGTELVHSARGAAGQWFHWNTPINEKEDSE